jgi:hypothetical protein
VRGLSEPEVRSPCDPQQVTNATGIETHVVVRDDEWRSRARLRDQPVEEMKSGSFSRATRPSSQPGVLFVESPQRHPTVQREHLVDENLDVVGIAMAVDADELRLAPLPHGVFRKPS